MKILALSDIHGDWERFLPGAMPSADLVLCAGDLTDGGVRGGGDALERAAAWLRALGEAYPQVLWVPGNHDIGVTEETFGDVENVACVLNHTVVLSPCDGERCPPMTVHGVSLCPAFGRPDLAARFDYMTDNPGTEATVYGFEPVDIVLSHCPPFGILDFWAGDDTHPSEHIGSPALALYLRLQHPSLVICGHVHGDTGCIRAGHTWVYNLARRWEVIDL